MATLKKKAAGSNAVPGQPANGANPGGKKAFAAVRGNSIFVSMGAATTAAERPVHALTGMEKIQKVREGVSKNDLEILKEKTGLDYDSLARIFSVAKATLFNKKGEEKFNPSLSEKIFALANLYSYGYEVFGGRDHFNKWMELPNRALGGQAPVDLLDTIFGIEEVFHLVGRIAYGVFS